MTKKFKKMMNKIKDNVNTKIEFYVDAEGVILIMKGNQYESRLFIETETLEDIVGEIYTAIRLDALS